MNRELNPPPVSSGVTSNGPSVPTPEVSTTTGIIVSLFFVEVTLRRRRRDIGRRRTTRRERVKREYLGLAALYEPDARYRVTLRVERGRRNVRRRKGIIHCMKKDAELKKWEAGGRVGLLI